MLRKMKVEKWNDHYVEVIEKRIGLKDYGFTQTPTDDCIAIGFQLQQGFGRTGLLLIKAYGFRHVFKDGRPSHSDTLNEVVPLKDYNPNFGANILGYIIDLDPDWIAHFDYRLMLEEAPYPGCKIYMHYNVD